MISLPKSTQYLNSLRVLAITGVIMGHIFMTICAYFTPVLSNTEIYFCVVFRNLWHWCIPLFAMISGVLFLNPQKEITIERLFKKYICRILLALFVFGVPYAFAAILVDAQYHFNIRQIGTAFLYVIRGKSENHLWYLYFIVGLYLLVPLLRVFTDNAGKKKIEYILIVLFVFTSILPLLKNIFLFDTGFHIPVNSIYVFYFLLGHYIHQYHIEIDIKILLFLLFSYGVYVVLISLNDTMIITALNGQLLSLESDSPIVAIVSVALFCLFHQINKTNKIIEFLSPLCFGIYLIHPLILFSLYLFLGFTPERYPLIIVILGTIVITVFSSIGFIYLGKKIHVVEKYLL
jgi:surface polysaccharide O-acyltransferase-like enzyme